MEIDPHASQWSRFQTLTCKTYVLTRPVYDLNDLVQRPEKYLIDIHAHPEEAAQAWKQRRRKEHDREWGEGLISLTYDGQELVAPDLWDDITPLWTSLLNVVRQYQREGHGEVLFPDQPIPIVLETRKGGTYFTVGDRTRWVDPDVFIRGLVDGAEQFFQWIERYLPEDISWESEGIASIRAHL